jgi:hypothetical protein
MASTVLTIGGWVTPGLLQRVDVVNVDALASRIDTEAEPTVRRHWQDDIKAVERWQNMLGELSTGWSAEFLHDEWSLARLSGVRQPSISQFLSGRVDLSDDQLDRLLSCMGYRLEVSRRPVVPELTRSERRSWRLHCRLSIRLTPASLQEWRPVIERNLKRLRTGVTGQPHSRNLARWESLVGTATCSACTGS